MQNLMFNLVNTRTKWLSQRHGVLAQNLANADTPRFEAKDLKALDLRGLQRLNRAGQNSFQLAQTHPAHVKGAPVSPMGALRAQEVDAFEIAPNGNSVVVEEQVSLMANNQLDYQLMNNIYRKSMEMMRTALGRGQ